MRDLFLAVSGDGFEPMMGVVELIRGREYKKNVQFDRSRRFQGLEVDRLFERQR